MIVIGEKINASRREIAKAVEARDAELIARLAIEQAEAGADYIDVNGAHPAGDQEARNVAWLTEVVQEAVDAGICIDSANPLAAQAGLGLAKRKAILNSISLAPERLGGMLPLLERHDCMVVALLVPETHGPPDTEQRLSAAATLIEKITAVGKGIDEIILDPGLLPVSVDCSSARTALESIEAIRLRWPEVHIGAGVSNASYGLPKRRFINHALLVLAIEAGMDYCIIDPCVEGAMGLIHAAEVVAGRDENCAEYLKAARAGKLT